ASQHEVGGSQRMETCQLDPEIRRAVAVHVGFDDGDVVGDTREIDTFETELPGGGCEITLGQEFEAFVLTTRLLRVDSLEIDIDAGAEVHDQVAGCIRARIPHRAVKKIVETAAAREPIGAPAAGYPVDATVAGQRIVAI